MRSLLVAWAVVLAWSGRASLGLRAPVRSPLGSIVARAAAGGTVGGVEEAKKKPRAKAKPKLKTTEPSVVSAAAAAAAVSPPPPLPPLAVEEEDEPTRIYVTNSELGRIKRRKTAAEKGQTLEDGDDVDEKVLYVSEDMLRKARVQAEGAEAAAAAAAAAVDKPTRTAKAKKLTAREATGLTFSDDEGVYDVPIIKELKWYRLQVRKASENTVVKALEEMSQTAKWRGQIAKSFVQHQFSVKMKGEGLAMVLKPMIPGMVYVNACMGPEVADAIESIRGVSGLMKNKHELVLPLTDREAYAVETNWLNQAAELKEEFKLLKKDEYVSVVGGPHRGTYGILNSVKSGKLEVILRGETKDEWVLVDAADVRYLANPPEKKWKEMTAKEAVESLMQKNLDGHNPTIKALKKAGLLNEILYGHNGADRPEYKRRLDAQGFEERDTSGKRERSIAKPAASAAGAPAPKVREWSPKRPVAQGADDWGANTERGGYQKSAPGSQMQGASLDQAFDSFASSFSSSFAPPGAAAGTRAKQGIEGPGSSLLGGERDEDFDSFIQDLLDDLDEDPRAGATGKGSAAKGTKQSRPPLDSGDFDMDWLGSEDRAASAPAASSRRKLGDVREGDGDSDALLESLLRDLADGGKKPKRPTPAAARAMEVVPVKTLAAPSLPTRRDTSIDELLGDDLDDLDFGSDLRDPAEAAVPSETTAAPRVSDFGSFEQYMAALVSFEKGPRAGGESAAAPAAAAPTPIAVYDPAPARANRRSIGAGLDYSSLGIKDLRDLLRARNVSWEGTKAELRARLKETEVF